MAMLATEGRKFGPVRWLRDEVTVRRVAALIERLAPAAVTATIVLLGSSILVGAPVATQALLVILCGFGLLWVRMERGSLERELHEARVRALDAIDLERQRLQRDLHDSAQQRLISVRIHLGMLADRPDGAAVRESLDQLGGEIDAALEDIRTVTLDGAPFLLFQAGIPGALRSIAANAPLPVVVEAPTFGRYETPVERGIYYCCLEALQNVVKHAGPTASARIRLEAKRGRITFTVEDSGVGFDPAHVRPGDGLLNLRDRVAVMGGRLTIDSQPGLGTRILGDVPIPRAA
jgi:signal transduction histidine kinase